MSSIITSLTELQLLTKDVEAKKDLESQDSCLSSTSKTALNCIQKQLKPGCKYLKHTCRPFIAPTCVIMCTGICLVAAVLSLFGLWVFLMDREFPYNDHLPPPRLPHQ